MEEMIPGPPLPPQFISQDLFKPVWSAAWTGLFFTIFEGMRRGRRLTLFAVIVMAGSVYLIMKHHNESEE